MTVTATGRAGPWVAGLAVAAVFFAASLTPSLIPKSAALQGLVGGLVASAGYLIAIGLRGIWRFLHLPDVHALRVPVALLAGAAGGAALVLGFSVHRPGQEDIRAIMGMEPLAASHEAVLSMVALAVFAILYAAGRLLAAIARRIRRGLEPWFPPRLAIVLSVLTVGLLSWYLSNGVLLRVGFTALDGAMREIDARIDPDLPMPADPLRSGSAASLVPWETLGATGRDFIAQGWTSDRIGAFHGDAAAQQPIRLYAGLNSAGDPVARAQLLLEEMIRVGAFERSVLVVVTPTGTGWVDPEAVDPLEVMHRGDTAIVAMQYSYLMSPAALVFEPDLPAESARALVETVHDYWSALPEDTRPGLFLFGLSLGSYGSEQAYSPIRMIDAPISGALWSGPTYNNVLWRQLTRGRNPGSPVWRPEIDDGRAVRFTNQQNTLRQPGQSWSRTRLIYLQYASDPITFFEFASALRPSDWLIEARAPDVSAKIRWYPVVTMVQTGIDMLAGTEVPEGFGHLFAAEHYIDAFAELTAPEGWSADQAERLKAAFR